VRLPLFDATLWAAGPFVNAVLLIVLFHRRRLPQFRALALWSLFSILASAIFFFLYRFASRPVYARAYWTMETADALLQLAVIAEVASIVFRPIGVGNRRRRLLLAGSTAVIIIASLVLAISVHPSAATRTGLYEIRGQLFTSLLVCIVFTIVLFASQKLGLYWRSHVMSVGYGLTVWAITSLLLDLLHGYLGRSNHFLMLEHIRMATYLGIFFYWIIALWRNEPDKKSPPPEMRDAILQMTDKVSYDLAQVLGTGQKELH
jgi:hypothetical protein